MRGCFPDMIESLPIMTLSHHRQPFPVRRFSTGILDYFFDRDVETPSNDATDSLFWISWHVRRYPGWVKGVLMVRLVAMAAYLFLGLAAQGCAGKACEDPADQTGEGDVLSQIQRMHGTITIDDESPEKPMVVLMLGNTRVTDTWLVHLDELPRLRVLILTNTNISDAGLAHVRGLKSLRQLSLYGSKVTDDGLANLSGLTDMQVLSVRGTNAHLNRQGTHVTDAGLEHLKGLTALQFLDLTDTEITDAGLRHLEGLTNLGTLNLGGTHVTDAGLVHLEPLSKLQDLELFNTRVTDAGLTHLKRVRSLQWLDLGSSFGPRGETQITDAGLEQLTALTDLWYLDLWGTQVTAQGASRLQKALPKCRVRCPDGVFEASVPLRRERVPGTSYWKFRKAENDPWREYHVTYP